MATERPRMKAMRAGPVEYPPPVDARRFPRYVVMYGVLAPTPIHAVVRGQPGDAFVILGTWMMPLGLN